MISRRRCLLKSSVVGLVVGGAALWGLQTTATTQQGVNFAVASHPLPLAVKLLDFVHRDAHYCLLARDITADCRSDHERVLAVFDWTRRSIQPTPRDWPIVDDHILHIVIRGHGLDDQMADVFCTLATYAGVPAFWKVIRDLPGGAAFVLSFAKVDGAWRVFDVAHGVVFVTAQGHLLEVDTLMREPALATDVVLHRPEEAIPYAAAFERLRPFTVPPVLRAEQQMPWRRLLYEARRALHLISQTELTESTG